MTRVGYWLDQADVAKGGTAQYAWRLLEYILDRRDRNWDVVILCRQHNVAPAQALARRLGSHAAVSLIPDSYPLTERALCKMGRMFAGGNHFHPQQRWYRSLGVDLLHVPYSYAPPGQPPCPWIFTMHDVQELHFPEFFSAEERAVRARRNWQVLPAASGVVASFNHIQQDLLKYFDLPASKVFVCPLPFQKIQLSAPTAEEEASLREKHASEQDFVLYPATTWPHKNHLGLIRALEHIRQTTGRQVRLLCTGHKTPDFYPKIEQYLRTSPVAAQVRFLGMVSEAELHWLYKRCTLVVVPTLYEAGSFPLLEAMALGVPVICSTVTSLPETIGAARFTFPPNDVLECGALILRLLDDTALRQENVAHGRVRMDHFRTVDSWPSIEAAWQGALQSRAQCA